MESYWHAGLRIQDWKVANTQSHCFRSSRRQPQWEMSLEKKEFCESTSEGTNCWLWVFYSVLNSSACLKNSPHHLDALYYAHLIETHRSWRPSVLRELWERRAGSNELAALIKTGIFEQEKFIAAKWHERGVEEWQHTGSQAVILQSPQWLPLYEVGQVQGRPTTR